MLFTDHQCVAKAIGDMTHFAKVFPTGVMPGPVVHIPSKYPAGLGGLSVIVRRAGIAIRFVETDAERCLGV